MWYEQSLNNFSVDKSAFDDLFDILFLDTTIPDPFRVYHDRHAVFTRIETACCISSNDRREPTFLQFVLERIANVCRPFVQTAAFRMIRFSFVQTNKKMTLISCHDRMVDGWWRLV